MWLLTEIAKTLLRLLNIKVIEWMDNTILSLQIRYAKTTGIDENEIWLI